MEQKNYRVLLSQKNFLKLFAADMISRFGDSLDAIAYSWIMYEVTGSASLMALVIGLNYLPTVFFMPIAGALVDRIDKKRIMVLSDVLRFCIVLIVALLYSYGVLNSAIIIIFTILTSMVEAFRIPAGGAFLPRILEQDLYTIGKAVSYSGSRISELLGYITSGIIISCIGSEGALFIDAATFLISALLIGLIKYEENRLKEKRKTKDKFRELFKDFREGLLFVKGSKPVKVVAIIGLMINFGIMPLSVFQTPYVSSYLEMGPTILSYIKILMSVGMMLGAIILPKTKVSDRGRVVTFSGSMMGVTLIMMYVAPMIEIYALKMLLLTISMFFVGFGGGILNVVVGSTIMKSVPNEMMGRVSAFNGSIMQASMPIASFICSGMAYWFEVPLIFAIFGIITMMAYLMMFVAGKFKSI